MKNLLPLLLLLVVGCHTVAPPPPPPPTLLYGLVWDDYLTNNKLSACATGQNSGVPACIQFYVLMNGTTGAVLAYIAPVATAGAHVTSYSLGALANGTYVYELYPIGYDQYGNQKTAAAVTATVAVPGATTTKFSAFK